MINMIKQYLDYITLTYGKFTLFSFIVLSNVGSVSYQPDLIINFLSNQLRIS